MQKDTINYQVGKVQCQGQAFYNSEHSGKKPAVIIAHAWKGQDSFVSQKASELAELGYVGFTADIYGIGQANLDDEKAASLMKPLFKDRALLRERIIGAYEAIKIHPEVDQDRIGGIGFCFGGLTIIELFKSGTPVRGVVSFHGVLGETLHGEQAAALPIAQGIKGSILILHGNEDPMVSKQDIENFQITMTEARVDWQMDIYGHAVHAFTNPQAHDRNNGKAYDAKAAKRSWQSMCNFFEEVFAK